MNKQNKIEWIPKPICVWHDQGYRWAIIANGRWIARIVKEHNGDWTSGNSGDIPDTLHPTMREASQRLVKYALEHL